MVHRMIAHWLLRFARRFEFWVLVFTVLVLIPQIWARYFEAKFLPVISRLEITTIEQIEIGSSINGRARRLRDCNWVETRWWLGRRGEQRVPVPIQFRDPPQIRSTGATNWSGIVIVGLMPDQVLRNSHANVVYRCYGGLWSTVETVVPFFDGTAQDSSIREDNQLRDILDAVDGLRDDINDRGQ